MSDLLTETPPYTRAGPAASYMLSGAERNTIMAALRTLQAIGLAVPGPKNGEVPCLPGRAIDDLVERLSKDRPAAPVGDQTSLIDTMVSALQLAAPVCEDAMCDAQLAIDNPPADADEIDIRILHQNHEGARRALEAVQAAIADAASGA